MKLILRNVKIYGFDPNNYRTFSNNGKETKQYSLPLYISESDKAIVDSYIYGKTMKNDKGEIVFYGKSKTPISIFDADKKKINHLVNEVFFADVSILIDEFKDRDTDETIRYSKCLGIQYLSKVEAEKPKMPEKTYDTYDEIFKGEDAIEAASANKPPLPAAFPDLPFDANGNEVKENANPEPNNDLPF